MCLSTLNSLERNDGVSSGSGWLSVKLGVEIVTGVAVGLMRGEIAGFVTTPAGELRRFVDDIVLDI
jgi:hypothetical protein